MRKKYQLLKEYSRAIKNKNKIKETALLENIFQDDEEIGRFCNLVQSPNSLHDKLRSVFGPIKDFPYNDFIELSQKFFIRYSHYLDSNGGSPFELKKINQNIICIEPKNFKQLIKTFNPDEHLKFYYSQNTSQIASGIFEKNGISGLHQFCQNIIYLYTNSNALVDTLSDKISDNKKTNHVIYTNLTRLGSFIERIYIPDIVDLTQSGDGEIVYSLIREINKENINLKIRIMETRKKILNIIKEDYAD